MDSKKLMQTIVIIALTSSIFIGCITKQGLVKNKSGDYELYIIKSGLSHAPIVTGRIKEYKSNDTLNGGTIKVDNKIINNTDKFGKFTFNIKPGKHTITGVRIGWYYINSKKIIAKVGDTIKIVFYLKQDSGSFIDPFLGAKKPKNKH